MGEETALAALASISNATRLRILKVLVAAGEEGLTAGTIAATVGASPSRASFHLSTMTGAGLISSQRRAREITYRANFEAIGGLIRYLLEDCCGDNAVVRACCLPTDRC